GIRDFHVTGVQTCALPIFAVFEVPQPAVNQLGRTPRRTEPEVLLFEEGDAQPRPGGFERDPAAVDSPANDGEVERWPGRQAVKQIGRASWREGGDSARGAG